jgi:hypothetical protein
MGTSKASIFVEPENGDCVFLFSGQHYVSELKFNAVPSEAPSSRPYSLANIKGFLVQPNEEPKDSVNIHVDSNQNITIDIKGKTTIACKDTTDITLEKASTITCKDTADVVIEKASTITCKDTTDVTLEKASTITCKDDVTVDASNKNVTLKSSKFTINDHVEVT